MSPRALIAVVVSLIAGLLLGRIGPQADLRRANERIDELKKEMSGKSRSGSGAALSGVKSMLNVSKNDMEAGARARKAREKAASGTNEVSATGTVVVAGSTEPATNAGPRGPRWHVASSNEVEKLKKAWALRADIARTNFVSRVKLNEQQTQDFDVLVEAMNLRIGATIDKWAAKIRQEGDMRPETGVRMMTDLGNAMVLTYDEMDRKLPAEWRENAGAKFELVNFIDPEVLTPLQDLEGFVNKGDKGPP